MLLFHGHDNEDESQWIDAYLFTRSCCAWLSFPSRQTQVPRSRRHHGLPPVRAHADAGQPLAYVRIPLTDPQVGVEVYHWTNPVFVFRDGGTCKAQTARPTNGLEEMPCHVSHVTLIVAWLLAPTQPAQRSVWIFVEVKPFRYLAHSTCR